jgi:folylpolyglutamate synthase
VTPAFDDYKWMTTAPDFKQTSEVNKFNFSLAVQLSATWLRNHNKIPSDVFKGDLVHSIGDKFVKAFNKCQFEGRFQRIERDNLTYFLDGAHTKESMEICSSWFANQTKDLKDAINILVFNVTGDRDSAAILRRLHSLNFNYVCFATNISTAKSDTGKNGELS